MTNRRTIYQYIIDIQRTNRLFFFFARTGAPSRAAAGFAQGRAVWENAKGGNQNDRVDCKGWVGKLERRRGAGRSPGVARGGQSGGYVRLTACVHARASR